MKYLITLLLIFASRAALAEQSLCKTSPVSESDAVLQILKEVKEAGEIVEPERYRTVFHEDVNADGIADLLVACECGNHSCRFHLFLAVANGKYCRVSGSLGLTAGEAKRIRQVLPNTKEAYVDVVVFAGAGGADSGIFAKYRLKDQSIYEVCTVSFNMGPDSETKSDDALVKTAQCRDLPVDAHRR